jgi:hypothetical protein
MAGAGWIVYEEIQPSVPKDAPMDPYEEERLAKARTEAIAELEEAMKEGVRRGWFYAQDDGHGATAYGLTEEGKQAMERGDLG